MQSRKNEASNQNRLLDPRLRRKSLLIYEAIDDHLGDEIRVMRQMSNRQGSSSRFLFRPRSADFELITYGGYSKSDFLINWDNLFEAHVEDVTDATFMLVRHLQLCCVPCNFYHSSQHTYCDRGHIMEGPEIKEVGWCCRRSKACGGMGCKRGINDFSLKYETPSYTCEFCNFELCDLCAIATSQSSSKEHERDEKCQLRKTELLQHIHQYLTKTKSWFCDEVIETIADLVRHNIFRPLQYSRPPELDDQGVVFYLIPWDDEFLDPAWDHLQYVYKILLRVVTARFKNNDILLKYFSDRFMERLVHMFTSQDPREREDLKMVVHRLYGELLTPRPYLRKVMRQLLHSIIHGTEKILPGMNEILEILGSIINGLQTPLKEEYLEFYHTVLIPLHTITSFNQEMSRRLNYCITQFITKDKSLTIEVLIHLLRHWPSQSSPKQLLYLTEIREILDIVESETVDPIMDDIFHLLGNCMNSMQFQIAEFALNLVAQKKVAYYIKWRRKRSWTILFPYLERNVNGHWRREVRERAQKILDYLEEIDPPCYSDVVLTVLEDREAKELESEHQNGRWSRLEDILDNPESEGLVE